MLNAIILTLLVSILGVFVGAFINAVVFRTRTGKWKWQAGAKCRSCEEVKTLADFVPIVSYFALHKRCQKCKPVTEWQYPIIEIVTGILFGIFFARAWLGIGFPDFVSPNEWFLLFIRDAILSVFLLIIFVYDLRYSYILDIYSIPAIIAAFIYNLLLGADHINLMLSIFIFGAFFAIQFIVSGGQWIGGGDVRMGMLMGALLGVLGGVLALFIAYIGGAFVGVSLILLKKKSLQDYVPFGTFLAGATILVMLVGQPIVDQILGYLI